MVFMPGGVGVPISQRKAALAHFALVVRKLREQIGFPTARSFYESVGGKAVFGCTYKAYLNVENGVSAPQPRMVEKLVAALRLAHNEERARSFAAAYLRVLLGSDEFVELAIEALGGGAAAQPRRYEPPDDMELSAAQIALLHKNPEAFWALTALANDQGSWRPEQLAETLGLPRERLAKALLALKAAKLVTAKGGAYQCASAGRALVPAGVANNGALRQGETIVEHPLLFRASEAELANYFRFMASTLRRAGLYATTEQGPDTHLYVLEASVLKLLPF